MTVLHFIKNLDKNNLSGLFMNDLLKGGIDKTTTHILTMSVNDNMEDSMRRKIGTNKWCNHRAISYSYDSNYKILQVEKFRNIVYK